MKGHGNLTELFRQSLNRKECENISEISIYKGLVAEKSDIKSEVMKLVAAFPNIKTDFIIVLTDRIIENGFTKERVHDAISKVIDTNP